MSNITPATALSAAIYIGHLRDDLLAFYHTKEKDRLQWAMDTLTDAAKILGYTLTPIVTPSPDSGRAKEIGDVFQNHGA